MPRFECSDASEQTISSRVYSPSLDSSPPWPASAFLAGFLLFFLFFLFLEPVDLASGRSRILRISSSSIFLSVLNLDRSGWFGAASRVMPFLVIAVNEVSS